MNAIFSQCQLDSMFSPKDRRLLWDALLAPTEATFELAMQWAANVVTTRDPMNVTLLKSSLEGFVQVSFDATGSPLFQMTPLGRAHVEEVMLQDPSSRELMGRLDAVRGTKTPLPPLKNGGATR